jgi:pimeloyl-ACP methyl ester carboxylesterase
LCAEDAPRLAVADTMTAGGASPLGVPIVGELLAACVGWPRGAADATPVTSSVPILLMSGALDPATPVEWADSVAAVMPRSVHLVNPTGGHSALYSDGVRLIGQFVRAPFARVPAS